MGTSYWEEGALREIAELRKYNPKSAQMSGGFDEL